MALRTALGKRAGAQLVTVSTAGYDHASTLGRLREKALSLPDVTRDGTLTVARSDAFAMLSEWMAARVPIEARLNRAKAALARSIGTGAVVEFMGNPSALRESWDDLPLARRRAILSTVLDHVTIRPGRRGFNRFDPGRVAPVWSV